jgi:hypothetical protein
MEAMPVPLDYEPPKPPSKGPFLPRGSEAKRIVLLAVLALAFVGWHLLKDFRVAPRTRALSVSVFVAVAGVVLGRVLPPRP